MVEIGADTPQLSLKLLPEALIYGQVTGDDGEPIEGAEVQAFTLAPIDGYTRLMPISGIEHTDEDGNFRIAGLSQGEYRVTVKPGDLARGLLKAIGHTDRAYPLVLYYPSIAGIEAAAPVTLVPGQHQEANFGLNSRPAFGVSGKIVAVGQWRQISQPWIVQGPEPWQQLVEADRFDQKSGEFEFRALPAGAYEIQVSGTDEQGRPTQNLYKLEVTHPVANLKLPLRPSVNIPVVIRTDFTKSAAQHNCVGTLNGKPHYFNCFDSALVAMHLIAEGRGREDNFIVDPESPVLRGVQMGRYRVKVDFTSPDYYIESMRSGMQDLLRQPFIVGESVPAPIEMTVRDDAATLKVHIEGAKESPQIAVLLVPDGEPPLIQMWSGGGDKTADFHSLAPGTYQVFAFDSLERLSYAEPGALDEYSNHAAKVDVASGGTTTVSVDVVHVEK
jgi:hypothetical protein